jgi:hypothetical protein
MLCRIESTEIGDKLKKIFYSMSEQDAVLKEKFDKFITGTPDLKVEQSEADKERSIE